MSSAFDSKSFLELCKELRKLGACKVEGWGFAATFVPAGDAHLPKPAPVTPHKRAAKAAARREDEPTAEQKREAMYAKELGGH